MRYPRFAGFLLAAACAPAATATPQPQSVSDYPPWVPCVTITAADTVWPSDSLDVPLSVISTVPSKYPAHLRDQHVEGSVLFAFRVQPSGRIDPCSVVQQPGASPGFEAAAKAWLLSSIYPAPVRHGQPVHASTTQRISFRLAP